jgi:integrase
MATGLRRSELAALTWDAADLDERTVEVRATRHRISKQAARVTTTVLVESAPKNRTSHRTVPLVPAVVALLRAHRAAQAAAQIEAAA